MEISYSSNNVERERARREIFTNLITANAVVMVGGTGLLANKEIWWWWVFLLATLASFAVTCLLDRET